MPWSRDSAAYREIFIADTTSVHFAPAMCEVMAMTSLYDAAGRQRNDLTRPLSDSYKLVKE